MDHPLPAGVSILKYGKHPIARRDSPCKGFGKTSGAPAAQPPKTSQGGGNMLYWALIFFVVSIIAAVFGFTGVSTAAAGIAKILFFVFLIVFIVFLITGMARRRRPVQ